MQVGSGQTLLDVAIQATGDAEQTKVIAANMDYSITEKLVSGQQVATPTAAINKGDVVEIMNKGYNIPASDDNAEIKQGIGFWRIGIDFKIS